MGRGGRHQSPSGIPHHGRKNPDRRGPVQAADCRLCTGVLDELRRIWSSPITRETLFENLAADGCGKDELTILQKLIDAEKSDLFDVIEFVSFALQPITREKRVALAQFKIFAGLDDKQKDFLEFGLSKYIETGVEELDQEKLPDPLTLKYQAIERRGRNTGRGRQYSHYVY